jgi:hypothetical protein
MRRELLAGLGEPSSPDDFHVFRYKLQFLYHLNLTGRPNSLKFIQNDQETAVALLRPGSGISLQQRSTGFLSLTLEQRYLSGAPQLNKR